MGYDLTCIISGFPNASSCNEVLLEYFEELCGHIKTQIPEWQPSRSVQEAFSLYTDEDEENRKQMVLIGPFDEQGNVRIDIPEDPEVAMPLIRALHDVVPVSGSEAYHAFQSTRDQHIYYVHAETPELIFVNASALRVLSLAAPHLTPARLWALKLLKNGPHGQRSIPDVEYGPVGAGGMYVSLCMMEDDPDVDAWMIEFLKGGVVDDEHRKEMMMGMGRQWVFVRPDRFPVAEAFAYRPRMPRIPGILDPSESHRDLTSLPIDILVQIGSHLTLSSLLTFVTLSRWMLSSLGPSIDYLVQSYIARNEPWLLPPNDGGTEISWWHNMMRTAEQLHGDTFSWVAYLKACGESASMKNRARIWRISTQLADMADELNIAYRESHT